MSDCHKPLNGKQEHAFAEGLFDTGLNQITELLLNTESYNAFTQSGIKFAILCNALCAN